MKTLALACSTAVLAAALAAPAFAGGPPPGTPAPNFTAQDVDGVDHSLTDFRGKVVMLNFWASW